MPECASHEEPLLLELDGKLYPSCAATGVFYAPPVTGAALADLLWPDSWSLVPEG